ncbi:protein of unknown function [Tenacibaculum sp. MAR_2009_124]|uniref:TraQ conjugal transfer family protein n=1 Tax=Tenacibaculum sp. MAR_2009_124 TaxID=1250059 RepID=UPI00089A721B|nr:TraQ conjugal transfer family protein [Tenacibaculum sp. MAR_2009_124]SEB51516.1 protein of unknown function [Tenacibaculum sp. MAR_2009_124]
MKKLIYLAILIITFTSCDSSLEVDIQDSFDFTIKSNQKDVSFISEEIKTTVKIEPERKVDGTKYFFSYEPIKGNGYYKLNESILTPGQEYEINGLNLDLFYVGEDIEIHEVEIKVKNDSDLLVKHNITYKIVDLNDFKVNVINNSNEEVFFTENVSFDLEIEKIQTELEQELTYDVKFIEKSLDGALTIDGNQLELGNEITGLSEGRINVNFLASESGNLYIKLLVKASNGKSQEVTVNYKIKATKIVLKVTPELSSNYVETPTKFNFEISKEGVENLTYELSFDGANGELKNENETFTNNQFFIVNEGIFEMDFSGLETSNNPLEFKLKVSNGTIEEILVDFEIKQTDFDFNITPNTSSNYVMELTLFDFDISKYGDQSLTYKMTFTGPRGEIKYRSNPYSNNQNIPLNFNIGGWFTYRGNEISSSPILFTITASNGVSKTKTINFESTPTEFEAIPSSYSLSQVYHFGIFLTINLILPEVQNQYLTYRAYFKTTDLGNISVKENNTGVSFSAGQILDLAGNRAMRLNISQSGTLTPKKGQITFVIIDSNNVEKEVTIDLEWTDF